MGKISVSYVTLLFSLKPNGGLFFDNKNLFLLEIDFLSGDLTKRLDFNIVGTLLLWPLYKRFHENNIH